MDIPTLEESRVLCNFDGSYDAFAALVTSWAMPITPTARQARLSCSAGPP